MNFPTFGGVPEPGKQLLVNPLNFSDMGYDVTGPQVHADGEIWSATNFSIRQALIDKYDQRYPADDDELQADCADGRAAAADRARATAAGSSSSSTRILLMPTNPSMLAGPRRAARRRPDALRRREPEGALARVRAARLRPERDELEHDREHRHRSDAGLRAGRAPTPATVHVRGAGTRRRRPSRPGSTSATTRPGSRRSPTPTRPPPARQPRRHGAVRARDVRVRRATRPATATSASARRSQSGQNRVVTSGSRPTGRRRRGRHGDRGRGRGDAGRAGGPRSGT